MTESRFNRYRELCAQLGTQRARALIDRLQVLALIQPDAVREFEAFITHERPARSGPPTPELDRPQDPDR